MIYLTSEHIRLHLTLATFEGDLVDEWYLDTQEQYEQVTDLLRSFAVIPKKDGPRVIDLDCL